MGRSLGAPREIGVETDAGTGDGAVAQLGERLVRNEEVRGSIPLSSTIAGLPLLAHSLAKHQIAAKPRHDDSCRLMQRQACDDGLKRRLRIRVQRERQV
jgi:hypothetical protein